MIEVKVPALGESITTATVANLHKKAGDTVFEDDIILELETEKINLEITAPETGVLAEVLVNEGDEVTVDDLVAKVEAKQIERPAEKQAEEPKKEVETTTPTTQIQEIKQEETFVPADLDALSPAVRAMVLEHNVDLARVHASGKNGRVLKSDILEYLENKDTANFVSSNALKNKTALERNTRRSKIPNIRKTIAKRLKESQNTAAMLTTFNEVDMSEIIKVRKSVKQDFAEKHGVNLGFMSFFTKAACKALQEFEGVNAYFLAEDGEIEYHEYCDISIAVASEKGLFVPVIRNAESLSFDQIEKTIKDFGEKAKKGAFKQEDLIGGTFSITNGGIFGSMLSTPIINQPQSAILGMHKIVERPVVVDGQIVIRPIMYVALSYDHRIIDGAQAVSFLVKIKELLENPEKLLFDL
jgi:2-oxoglutarate dehydrogenase E2 component (dihydrolipoamide succinyltransferase)